MGEAGVSKMLNILHKELDVSMALTGTKDIREVGAHTLAK
jgi:L-lactate dehydrogenase (cytochrome)